jgi:uncharacterized protein YbjQ (UPF0145 family)
MKKTKDILVVTTSTVEGVKIQKYIKPISTHLVAGTNFFSDFLGGITDIIGGRSNSYQKQLASLYDEAIENLKRNAVEIGANCIIGLHIDLDEISGKGKSMFMVSAIGTAVLLENVSSLVNEETHNEISAEQIKNLSEKRKILAEAKENTLLMSKKVWDIITRNQIHEIYPFVLSRFQSELETDYNGSSNEFKNDFIDYIESLDEVNRKELLYDSLKNELNIKIANKLLEIIKELYLLDYSLINELLKSENLLIQKRGLMLLTFERQYYNQKNIGEISNLIELINQAFPQRGKITTKKQLLSSKEKEIWICECSKESDLGSNCGSCGKDIYGFQNNEIKPEQVVKLLKEKIELFNELNQQ